MWHDSLFEAYWRWFRLLQRYEFGKSWYRCEFCIPRTIRLSWASFPGCSFIKRRFWQDSRNHPSYRFTLATLISSNAKNSPMPEQNRRQMRFIERGRCESVHKCCLVTVLDARSMGDIELNSNSTAATSSAIVHPPFSWVSRKSAQNSINRFIHDILKMREPIA